MFIRIGGYRGRILELQQNTWRSYGNGNRRGKKPVKERKRFVAFTKPSRVSGFLFNEWTLESASLLNATMLSTREVTYVRVPNKYANSKLSASIRDSSASLYLCTPNRRANSR